MDRTAKPANEEMPSRASEWLVALTEQPANEALRAEFERWLAERPDHARDWAEIGRTSMALLSLPPLHEPEWGPFLRRRRSARGAAPAPFSDPRRRWLWRGAAAVAAAACAIFFLAGGLPHIEADYATATAEQRNVRLADGTIVLLGPESAIDVAYSATKRRVRTIDIAVRNGIVDVGTLQATAPIAERLEAGEWLRLVAGHVERGRVPVDQVAIWTQGQLVVKNRPVAEVVDALRPYFGGLVILRGATLAAQPLTGVYNLSDPVEALRAVARAQGATLHRISPWVVVISGD
jgi:transmembrane sensor